MGVYLNPNNELLRMDINSDIYVDKSMLISITNKKLLTNQRFICVSRPRRFGKSTAAHMLAAYYSKGCDSAELFYGLKIAQDDSFKKHLNKYNVFQLNILDFWNEEKTVSEFKNNITKMIIKELRKEFPDSDHDSDKLPYIFQTIYSETNIPFIFIIDEWDCIIRMKQNSDREQKLYLDFIRDLFKDRAYAALVYMTGILPIKKYGQHSALNMFREYSMTGQTQFAEFTGFTEEEVIALCNEHNISFNEAKEWYDGYNVDGISIYNPCSVNQAIDSRRFNSYWTATETYEALKKYIVLDMFGLHDKVTKLIAGEKLPVDTSSFVNDMTSFSCADDILTLLIHLGYLTFDYNTKKVWIPNNEVRQEYITSVKNSGWENVIDLINRSEELLNAVLSMDEKTAAALLEQSHQDNTSIFEYNDENSLSCVVALAFYAANKEYVFQREMPAGKGRADLILIPRKKSDKPGIVIELKHNDNAENALKQIKTKNYADSLRQLTDKALLVGISYDDNKHHSCKIEQTDIC